MTEENDNLFEWLNPLKKKLQKQDEKESLSIVLNSFANHCMVEDTTKTNLYEKFLTEFSKLKRLIKNTPQRIELKASNDDNFKFKHLIVDLMLMYQKIDNIESSSHEKKLTVPDSFEKAKKDFLKYHKEILKQGRQILKFSLKTIKSIAMENDLEIPAWFYDIAEKEDFLGFKPDFEYVYIAIENSIFMFENNEEAREPYDHALSSLKFLEKKVLGSDLPTLHERWKAAPPVFIPRHVVQKNPEALLKLYDEVVRTYTSGSYLACIAMCRSLFEHILIKYYGTKIKDEDGLFEIISYSQKKYEFLYELRLHEKRKTANDLIHNYDGKNIKDKIVLGYIQTVKSLIEKIPDTSKIFHSTRLV